MFDVFLNLLQSFFEGLYKLHFLVFSDFCQLVGGSPDLVEPLSELLFNLLVSLLSILDFFLDRSLKVWEVGVDAVPDDLDAFISRLALFVEVGTEQVFFLPERIVDSLHTFLSRRCDVLEPFLKHVLSLGDLLLPQIELSCLRLSLSIEELDDLLQLTVSLVESCLRLAKNFLEDVFQLVDLGLIFNGFP